MKNLILLVASLSLVTCANRGERPQDGKNGESIVGPAGPQGPAGSDGQDGKSVEGPAGPAGAPGTEIEIIDPCGKESDHDEVLLRVGGDTVLNHYTRGSGNNRKFFFSILEPGDYETVDGTECAYTVDADGNVTW